MQLYLYIYVDNRYQVEDQEWFIFDKSSQTRLKNFWFYTFYAPIHVMYAAI